MPFGQWPLLKEGDVTLAQGQAIIKHLARKCGMYGARNKFEDYLVDSFMIGAEALYNKFADGVLWGEGDKAENASKFESKHLDPSTKTERNGGAHLVCSFFLSLIYLALYANMEIIFFKGLFRRIFRTI